MGQLFYKYKNRVTLACFLARHPGLEVDSDPFTEKPEDSLVPSTSSRGSWSEVFPSTTRTASKVVGHQNGLDDQGRMSVGNRLDLGCKPADELSEGFLPPLSNTKKAGNLKLVVIGLSCISGVKGEPPFELSPVSSFDLVIAFCTSSNHRFTYRSCACTESIESDDKMSGSRGLCSASRWCAIDFSRTGRGLPIEFLVGNLALCGCAELVSWVPD
ncbi:hypothetical protein BHM03_00014085 [Ensete ventricosum]|uniref:Uncharacterized protein n=1 Tax=Ensete ventricosum TaxID=4639 RepID=A0A445MDZ9_ENSVE|nr:hypothetical protein BHM03_00014085 [Ensete ventricosum]